MGWPARLLAYKHTTNYRTYIHSGAISSVCDSGSHITHMPQASQCFWRQFPVHFFISTFLRFPLPHFLFPFYNNPNNLHKKLYAIILTSCIFISAAVALAPAGFLDLIHNVSCHSPLGFLRAFHGQAGQVCICSHLRLQKTFRCAHVSDTCFLCLIERTRTRHPLRGHHY